MDVLVDGDVFVYRAGFAAEHTEYDVKYYDPAFDEEVVVTVRYAAEAAELIERYEAMGFECVREKRIVDEGRGAALHNVRSMLERAVREMDAEPEDVTIYLSGADCFRYDIATIKPYKGNREDAPKPIHGPAIKEWMAKHYRTVVTEYEEADDALGIHQYGIWQDDAYGSVIVSNDKDLMMIPGLHYNSFTDERYFVDEWDAERSFMIQLLKGDPTDHIQGVPGIGDTYAEEALADVPRDEWMSVVRALYVQGYGEEDAEAALIENGQLLWIRREENEVWTP